MFSQSEMSRLVDLQQRSYRLFKWLAQAVSDGFIHFQTAHSYSTLSEAAEAWILGHYMNLPDDARPPREELSEFCAILSTYLTNSFDLISSPGKQLYSPDAHCFCPMCSWLVEAPNLKTKRLDSDDKRRAQKMRIRAFVSIATTHGINVRQEQLEEALKNRKVFEDASLVAYGNDLLQRSKGIANGPAVLALWRGFAWTESGSPKQGFRLKGQMILDAEKRLLDLLLDLTRTL